MNKKEIHPNTYRVGDTLRTNSKTYAILTTSKHYLKKGDTVTIAHVTVSLTGNTIWLYFRETGCLAFHAAAIKFSLVSREPV